MPTIYMPGYGYVDSGYAAGMSGGLPGAYGWYGGQTGAGSSTMGRPLVSQQFADQASMIAGVSGGAGGIGGAGGGRDPQTSAALSILQQMAEGKISPYDETTKTAMLTKASDMNAAAEAGAVEAANSDAAAGGASASDPSLAAARREFMARRQSGNASAANAIDQQANKANFGARFDAANALAGYDAQRQGAQAQMMANWYNNQYGSGRQNAGGVAGGAVGAGGGQFNSWNTYYDPSRPGGGAYNYQGNWLPQEGNTATGWSYQQAQQRQRAQQQQQAPTWGRR